MQSWGEMEVKDGIICNNNDSKAAREDARSMLGM